MPNTIHVNQPTPNSSTPPASNSSQPTPLPPNVLRGPRRQIAIVFGIGATIIISILAITLLYVKWYRVEEPTSIIVAWGFEGWDGVVVRVTGSNLPPEGLTGVITEKKGLMERFHVPPGNYEVTAYRKGQKVLRAQVKDLTHRSLVWPFRSPPTTTRPKEIDPDNPR